MAVLVSCNDITDNSWQGMGSFWLNDPATHNVDVSVINDGGTLPDGTTATSWKTLNGIAGGRCILTRPKVDPATGKRWVFGQYVLVDWYGATINLANPNNALLKVRFYTNHPEVPISFGIVTAPWTGYTFRTPALQANVWNEVAYDLRLDANGLVPDLTLFRSITPTQAEQGISQEVADDYYLLIDYITVEPATGQIALQAVITPSADIRLKTTETQVFNCVAAGGTGNYSFQWFVNGAPNGITSQNFTFVAQSEGTFEVYATVNDGQSSVTTTRRKIVVLRQLPPPVPTRQLHCDGPLLKDDTGKVVRLRGIMPGNWLSGAHKDVFDKTGAMRFSDNFANFAEEIPVIAQEIEGIRYWGFNTVRVFVSVYLWKTNLGGYRDNIKTYAQMLAANGLYLIVAGYTIGYYNHALNVPTPIPYPPHLTADEQNLLTSGGITWNGPQDFIAWIVDVATFLSDCNNVIIDLWNEPNADSGAVPYDTAKASWLSTCQDCVTAVRNANLGKQVLIVQWNYGSSYNFDSTDNSANSMDYAILNPIVDPTNNIVYSTHSYREYGQIGGWWTNWLTRLNAYKYEDARAVFANLRILDVAKNHPVFIGEFGANILSPKGTKDGTDSMEAEKQGLTNELKLMRDYGLNWAINWFRPDNLFQLVVGGAPNYTPNTMGEIVQNELGTTTPPAGIPWWVLPTIAGVGLVIYKAR